MQNMFMTNCCYLPSGSTCCPDPNPRAQKIRHNPEEDSSVEDTQAPLERVYPKRSNNNNNKNDEYCFAMKELPCNIHQAPKDVAYSMVEQQHQHMWIGDSGASCHFTNDDSGFIKWRSINDAIGVGNNDVSIATKVGTIR
jgi:hypothetical protein